MVPGGLTRPPYRPFLAKFGHRQTGFIFMDIVAIVAFFRSFGLFCLKLAISPWKKIRVVHELL